MALEGKTTGPRHTDAQRAAEHLVTRRAAWIVLWIGAAVSAGVMFAIDHAHSRGSGFFDDGIGWFYSHAIGGAAIMYALAAIGALIIVPARDNEARGVRWRRAGWTIVGFVAYGFAGYLLRL